MAFDVLQACDLRAVFFEPWGFTAKFGTSKDFAGEELADMDVVDVTLQTKIPNPKGRRFLRSRFRWNAANDMRATHVYKGFCFSSMLQKWISPPSDCKTMGPANTSSPHEH